MVCESGRCIEQSTSFGALTSIAVCSRSTFTISVYPFFAAIVSDVSFDCMKQKPCSEIGIKSTDAYCMYMIRLSAHLFTYWTLCVDEIVHTRNCQQHTENWCIVCSRTQHQRRITHLINFSYKCNRRHFYVERKSNTRLTSCAKSSPMSSGKLYSYRSLKSPSISASTETSSSSACKFA